MHSLNSRGVHSENLRIFPNCAPNNMDYHQKMVVPTPQKLKHEDDDDDDLEALRLAALKSLKAKHTLQSSQQPGLLSQASKPTVGYPSCPSYKHQKPSKRGFYQNRLPRQNGNTYYPSRVNQNLIEIVPVEEEDTSRNDSLQTDLRAVKPDIQEESRDGSKFYRYKDNASSDDEDNKESNSASLGSVPSSNRVERGEESGTEKETPSGGIEESPRPSREELSEEALLEEDGSPEEEGENADEEQEEEEEEEEIDEDEEEEQEVKPSNDDDDDVLLMADLEEEDSLERLMDEMEREMNVDKVEENKERKSPKRDVKELKKTKDEASKARVRKSRGERESDRNGLTNAATSGLSGALKNERRSVSPRSTTRISQKRRSHSPKPRLRKKSPRRSPRRSPARKKPFREVSRMRSPRKMSPPRFSPRPRSPKLSPRGRSPNNRSPARRTPPRKISPRVRSPHSRSLRIRRSRSPRVVSRSRSPGTRLMRSPKRSNRSKSPRIRSRSPRARTPVSKSPRISPVRTSSPRRSPRRLAVSPRPRSPKVISPEGRRGTSPVRIRSPLRISPHRSPWSSPRNSPRISPRRRRSPKESVRKTKRSATPEEPNYKREVSPSRKAPSSPEISRLKIKKDNVASTKEIEASNDPVLEARRRKFESTRPIDPIHDNKKIKLGKKESSKFEATEEPGQIVDSPKIRKGKIEGEYQEEDEDFPETDLCLTDDYVYEMLEDVASDDSSAAGNTVSMCVEMVPVKVEKTRSKKKKKRDKELYQAGKMKSELTLSERIGKEKKCKKRKDRAASPVESSPEHSVLEDLAVDDEEADLRTQLSRRRAERLNRTAPIQSARLLQSAFKGVVNEVAKTNAKVIQRHSSKGEEKKNNAKEVRRVTVLHRPVNDLPDSGDETTVDSKVPIRFRLGLNKPSQENPNRESKATRKSSKRQGRKVKHKNNKSLNDQERKN